MTMIQNWLHLLQNIDLEHLQRTLESYAEFGPLLGITLPLLEAFLPFLPLLVIVAANANIFGLWFGFLFSWIGVSIGALCVFWISRRLGHNVRARIERRFPRSQKFFKWIESRGFTPLFLLACFPFSPSSLINIVSGLSSVPFRTFAIATVLGKAVMILSISLISFDISSFRQEPWRIFVTIAVILVMWFGGKRLEARYQIS
ncbi:TVP38/TMEM64 family protein [Paenibacillus radicis (ex Gao et al. 2016)]|uniref:TVP38/TMEM64 family membrane protein n=1 Tax=Paenibacillus radicis (ex Gao et al. 2016) TaxID=1737354 RepID=A0A917H2P7_9BACL|nr:TVP38/TMEM64 family protein [Paenibacillus radicis (ex Gao et al. 2016)]GGG66076.1 putative membrane protein YhjE [Paenibacillus radicis (ex Gao et al. 2016)]